MGFKLAAKTAVTSSISSKVPDKNGYKKQSFTATLRKLYGDEKEAFLNNLDGRKDIDVVREICTDIKGLLDEEGNDLPFDDALIAMIEPVDYILTPLARECIAVQDESMRRALEIKN